MVSGGWAGADIPHASAGRLGCGAQIRREVKAQSESQIAAVYQLRRQEVTHAVNVFLTRAGGVGPHISGEDLGAPIPSSADVSEIPAGGSWRAGSTSRNQQR